MTRAQDLRKSTLNGIHVVTDRVSYAEDDQVFPLHPENAFILDEIHTEKLHGLRAAELGIGSGINSIALAREGAHVIATEINPRAKVFAGYNILKNRVEGRVEIRDGDTENIFAPFKAERFDYFLCNPPFEPTPPGIAYFTHSDGGTYGLDFVEKIFRGLESHLADRGHGQIVTFAPGDEQTPFMLTDMIEKQLHGQSELVVNPEAMRFSDFVNRFVAIGKATSEQIHKMKAQAASDGATHLHLCMLHYEQGRNHLRVRPSEKTYHKWDLPLDSKVPMGYAVPQ